MLTIRLFEQTIERLFLEGRIMGTAHTSIGQEAVATGVAAALEPRDAMTSTHRGHGHFIARGADPARVMAEMFGRDTGYSHGYGGSQMMMAPGIGFYGANGITAGSMAFAAGLALEAQTHKTGRVVLSIIGDGASNEGMFHEALNLATLWKLPVVYLVENNLYAMSTPVAVGLANQRIADRAAAYGIPGKRLDGNDFYAVRDGVKAALDYARAGNGPMLLECMTYRLTGHSKGDPRVYRTREEEAEAATRDPIPRMEAALKAAGLAAEGTFEECRKKAQEVIAAAIVFAENSPPADAKRYREGIFA
jgi:TPP-dependent pyruvate/acetoin dehydrogenase alpha subunit